MVISGCTDAGCPLVQDNIQRLAVTLYTELLSRLVSLINRYSAVQYSTVQYNTVQYSTVHHQEHPALPQTRSSSDTLRLSWLPEPQLYW